MKKTIYIFMILLLLISPLLMAAGGQGIRIKGDIVAIDAAAKTITVQTSSGDILVQVTGATKICEGPEPCVPIAFEDLEVGDRVGVTGQYVEGILYAKKIIVH